MNTIRLGLYQLEPERAKELAEAVVRQNHSCDTVWLAAIGYYPTLDYHRDLADRWRVPAEIFRAAGMRVSLQISNTMGHMDWAFLEPDSPFVRGMREDGTVYDVSVGPDGTPNRSCYCVRGSRFRQYIRDVMRIYAEALQPARIWLDDDLRIGNHRPNRITCYCDNCIAAFNAENGTHFTREELVRAINRGDVAWREKYVDFLRRGFYDFVYGAAEAALEVSPDTAFGYEYGLTREGGYGVSYVTDAMHDASGKEVHTRPGGGYYNDKDPFGQFDKAFQMDAQISAEPGYVTEHLAEIENLPGTLYGKSIQGILNEGTLDLVNGCTDLSFTDVQSCHEPMSYYERIFAGFDAVAPYWRRLSALSKTAYRGGGCFVLGKQPHLRVLDDDEPDFGWVRPVRESDFGLVRMGIPVTCDTRAPGVYILHWENARELTDSEIRFLLTRPVIADGASVDVLIRRGYGDYFPLTPEEIHDDIAQEHFVPHPVNAGRDGQFFEINPYAAKAPSRYIFRDLDARSQVIGAMYANPLLDDGSYYGPCSVITEICDPAAEKPVRWGIFAYSLFGDLASSAKRNQILETMDTLSPLCAKLLSEEQAAIYPAVDGNGRTVAVTVMSASQNGTEETRILVRNPAGTKLSAMSGSLKRIREGDIAFTSQEQPDGSLLVDLPPLLPYEPITLFLDGE